MWCRAWCSIVWRLNWASPYGSGNGAGPGGATLGTTVVAKADPDGYGILATSSALTIAPAIFPSLTFDAARDLSSVLMIGSSANVMIVPVSRPWKTAPALIGEAK